MSRWFRMYADVLDDPKVQKLPPPLFKVWVNLLCLTSRNDGILPDMADIAFALRMDENVTRDMVRDLSQRGLIDDADGLSPHNWAGRQFKSDKDETATERKRAQRDREKERKSGNVTPPVTDDVTRDNGVMSHPPEQSRAEQNRAEQTSARAEEYPHGEEVSTILKDRAADLDTWEHDFLVSVRWKQTLTKAQRESLDAIRAKLTGKGNASKPMISVKRGTPAFEAWVAYYRAKSKRPTTFHERQDAITVPTEFPPAMEMAA